ncbi:MAG TPA: nickel pincer cofactor biosynthesis protein LarB [Candidatus Latescibacteria bacterium]|nr:nickel pincer cofactor biosynthesis protein LarB [Candidatus Latescibacterota bacterium]
MDRESLSKLLRHVASGKVAPDEDVERLKGLPFEDLGFAHIDHHRAVRTGYPETIFCEGKTPDQTVSIAERILAAGSPLLATRVSPETAERLMSRFPQGDHDGLARTVVVMPAGREVRAGKGLVVVVSAGTSDIPVAREAVVTAQSMGARVEPIFDVGVAGIHRLLAYADRLRKARAVVVVAGMEGALASVVGGLVDSPVIAVPTSVGYGASFNGLAALLTMLNSCASGVSVVNIDNGYGGGYCAALISNRTAAATAGQGEDNGARSGDPEAAPGGSSE